MAKVLDLRKKQYVTQIKLASAPSDLAAPWKARVIPSQSPPVSPSSSQGGPAPSPAADTRPGAKTEVPLKIEPKTQRVEDTHNDLSDDEDIPIISWTASIEVHSQVSKYLAYGLFVLAGLLLVLGTDILAAIMFAFFGVWVIYRNNAESPVIEYVITPLEIHVGSKTYYLKDIKSFWIQYEPHLGIQELSLHLHRLTSSYVKIPLGDLDPVQIRSALIEFIPEEAHEETLVDLLSRLVGL